MPRSIQLPRVYKQNDSRYTYFISSKEPLSIEVERPQDQSCFSVTAACLFQTFAVCRSCDYHRARARAYAVGGAYDCEYEYSIVLVVASKHHIMAFARTELGRPSSLLLPLLTFCNNR